LGFHNVGLSTIWVLSTSAMWSLVFEHDATRWVCVGFVLYLCFFWKLFGCFGFLFEIRACLGVLGFLFEIRVSMGYFWVGLFPTKVKWWLGCLGVLGFLFEIRVSMGYFWVGLFPTKVKW